MDLRKLVLNCGAVTAVIIIAPRNNGTISQDGSKCPLCTLNKLYIREPMLDCRAIPTARCIAPRHHRSISKDSGECSVCGVNLLYIPEPLLDRRAVTAIYRIAPCNNLSLASLGMSPLRPWEPPQNGQIRLPCSVHFSSGLFLLILLNCDRLHNDVPTNCTAMHMALS